MDRPTPRADQTPSRRRRSYCLIEGWRCTYGRRCDEHQPDRDPPRVGDLFAGGGG